MITLFQIIIHYDKLTTYTHPNNGNIFLSRQIDNYPREWNFEKQGTATGQFYFARWVGNWHRLPVFLTRFESVSFLGNKVTFEPRKFTIPFSPNLYYKKKSISWQINQNFMFIDEWSSTRTSTDGIASTTRTGAITTPISTPTSSSTTTDRDSSMGCTKNGVLTDQDE